jgi:hypothetical protein
MTKLGKDGSRWSRLKVEDIFLVLAGCILLYNPSLVTLSVHRQADFHCSQIVKTLHQKVRGCWSNILKILYTHLSSMPVTANTPPTTAHTRTRKCAKDVRWTVIFTLMGEKS